jgi:hypothetical protein
MASNLSSIGFHFTDAEAFQLEMIRLAADTIERLECEAGSYAIWRSRTGAEIWFHLPLFGDEDHAADIEGLTPWLEGDSEVRLEIRRRIRRPADNAFEGAFEAWLGSGGNDDDGGTDHPIVFDAVDFDAHAGRALPFDCGVRLTGFARSLRAFADEAAFDAAQRGSSGNDRAVLASCAFVPIGMFAASAGDRRAVATSDALLTGTVLAHRRLVNEASGSAFHRLLVRSLACDIDIVADPDVVAGEIEVGGCVEVACPLFGRLLD